MPKYYPGEPKEYTFQQIYNNGVIGDRDVNGKLTLSGDAASAVQNTVHSNTLNGVTITLPTGVASMADALPKLRSAIAQARTGRHCKIGLTWDSIGWYNRASNNTLRAIQNAFEQLGLKVNRCNWLGNGNTTSIGVADLPTLDSRITLDPEVTVGAGLSFGYGDYRCSTVGKGVQFQCDEPVDTCVVIYRQNASSFPAPFTVDIGGSVLATSGAGQAEGVYLLTVPLGSMGFHKIYTKHAGTGGQQQGPIMGMMCYNSRNPGLTVLNLGWAGAKSSDLANATTPSKIGASYAALACDGVLVYEQINDWLANTDLTTRNASMATIISQAKNNGNTDVVLVNGPQSNAAAVSAPLARQDAYFAADVTVAATAQIPLISCRAAMGVNNGSVASPKYADDVGHPSPLGSGTLGQAVVSALVLGLA